MPVTPRRLRRAVPVKGRDTSRPEESIGEQYASNALNVRFRFSKVQGGPGRNILSGPDIAEAPTWLGDAPFVDGTTWELKLSTTKLRRFGANSPGVPANWNDIPGSFTPSGSRRWSAVAGENKFFFCRGESEIARWDGIVTNTFKKLSEDAGYEGPSGGAVNSTISARFVEYFAGHLVGGYVTEIIGGGAPSTFANRLRWAQSADYRKWDETKVLGAGFKDLVDHDQEAFRGMQSFGGKLYVYRRHTISEVFPTGQVDNVFDYVIRVDGVGCDAPYTIAAGPFAQYFLGLDKYVYAFNGTNVKAISAPIHEELSALIYPNKLDNYFGFVSPANQEYWLVLDTGDAFIYDYARDSWTRDSYPSLTAAAEVDLIVNAPSFLQLVGSFQAQSETFSQLAGGVMTTIFGGRSDGATMTIDFTTIYDYFAQGSIMDRFFETEDFILGASAEAPSDQATAMSMVTVHRVLLNYDKLGNTLPFEVGISTDSGDTWTTQSVVPNSTGFSFVDFNSTSNIVRFRFRENNALGQFRWREYTMQFEDAGDFSGTM